MDQIPVHLYDPIADYVNVELKRRSVAQLRRIIAN